MAKIINIEIERAIKNRKVDLFELAKVNPNPEYKDYIAQQLETLESCDKAPFTLTLDRVKDDMLCRRVIEYIWYEMTEDNLLPKTLFTTKIRALQYVLMTVDNSALDDIDDFIKHLCNEFKSPNKEVRNWVRGFTCYCQIEKYSENPYEADIWELDRIPLASDRINLSRHHKRIFFFDITREKNKHYVKDYIWYTLHKTDLSVTSIVGKLGVIKRALNVIDKPYEQWTSEDAAKAISEISKTRSKSSVAGALQTLEGFTEYLLIRDYIRVSPFKQFHELTHYVYKPKAKASDKYVLAQIFNALGQIDNAALVIWFLTMYCTGMRVSEVSQLKKDCLEKSKDTCFIRFYQTKMKKYVTNVIPKALYELISDYILTLPEETEYLFPGKQLSRPKQSSAFSESFAGRLESLGVVNPDGTPYHFTAHSFRHLMAVKMREADIPFQYIVEQLHHESPEMTLVYMEFLDRQKIIKMKQFINVKGEASLISSEVQEATDEEYAEYMRQNLNAQMLTDGICARPVKLGKCKHCNACLFCADYRTSSAFLSQHIEHLSRVNFEIEIAKKNGWAIQLQQAEKTKNVLESIIHKLRRDCV